MATKKLMNIHETLEYSENLDVSSQNDVSDPDHSISSGRLIILPAKDEVDKGTNENLGDENELQQINYSEVSY